MKARTCKIADMDKVHSANAPRSLAATLRKVTGPVFRKRGFAQQEMVTRWSTIVGPAVAEHSQPERIQFSRDERDGGVLHIRADGGFALELQHLEPILLERVNAYFGYRAVGKVAIKQGPLNRPPERRKEPQKPLTADQLSFVEETTVGARHEELKAALLAVGRSLFGGNTSD